ncbi:unnamed protein product [Diamesa hyperborea]
MDHQYVVYISHFIPFIVLHTKSVEPQENLNDYYEQPTATMGRPSNGLFDISDDEESLLPPKSPITKTVDIPSTSFFREQVPQRKLVNLFDDQPPELPPNEPEDSDHDIFDTPIETSKKDITKQPVDLFNYNEFDSYIKNMETSQNKTKLNEDPPLKEVAVIVKKPLPKITNLFDDEIETDYFDEIMKNKNIASTTTKLPAKLPVVAESNKPVKELPIVAKSSKISNLFSDDSPDDDFDDLFAKKPVEIMKKNIFDQKVEAPVKRKEPIDLFENKSTVDTLIPSFDNDSTPVENIKIPSFDNDSTVDKVIITSLNEEPPEIDWDTEDNYEDPFEKITEAIGKVSESNISFSSIPMFDDLSYINNCFGWGNHAHCTFLLIFAVIGYSHAAFIVIASTFRGLYRNYYVYYSEYSKPSVKLGMWSLILTVFNIGLSVGVVIAVGMLLYFQLGAIISNHTGYEEWILYN